MINNFLNIVQKLEPELAHSLTLKSLKFIKFINWKDFNHPSLNLEICNLNFDNPIGMAAGFDKNAEVFRELFQIGFGFVEAGTVTKLSQFGNPKPRVFRLKEDNAIINRLGFNNKGADNFLRNISKNKSYSKVLGINIGPNKNSDSFVKDIIETFKITYSSADYVTVNISSPNTESLRNMQQKENLISILREITSYRSSETTQKPIMIKVDPDNTEAHYGMILNHVKKFNIDGIITTNTTLNRTNDLISKNKGEAGGLSGLPLKDTSNNVLKFLSKESNGEVALIGVGGIETAKDVYDKIKFGASLVQLYTSMTIYGPGLINIIKKDLVRLLAGDGLTNIKDAIGVESR